MRVRSETGCFGFEPDYYLNIPGAAGFWVIRVGRDLDLVFNICNYVRMRDFVILSFSRRCAVFSSLYTLSLLPNVDDKFTWSC